jgi:uncharacterized protein (DUF697 family)
MDLRPLREQAQRGVRIALVGKPGSGRHALAAQMRSDPSRPGAEIATPLPILDLENGAQVSQADLVILVLNVSDGDDHLERALVKTWLDNGKRILVFINRGNEPVAAVDNPVAVVTELSIETWMNWGNRNVLVGSVEDQKFLTAEFVPAVMRLLPEYHLALARYLPLFRLGVARHMINDTCFTNAAYSLGTGLMEIVPILNIPMNVGDIIILTKNQVFLVYKLGLALGMPTELQSYITTFSGVLGASFFWRQVAYMLIGLIPGFGIIPKVGVAYGGTAVVGNVVLQWYLTGRHISRQQIRKLYASTSAMGRQLGSKLRKRKPRLKSGKKKKGVPELNPPQTVKQCVRCGKSNALDASFCQYCGVQLPGSSEGGFTSNEIKSR